VTRSPLSVTKRRRLEGGELAPPDPEFTGELLRALKVLNIGILCRTSLWAFEAARIWLDHVAQGESQADDSPGQGEGDRFRRPQNATAVGTAMHLSSNQELYDYLVRLAQNLKQRGAVDLSGIVTGVSGQAFTTSTEFFGESRIALRRILAEKTAVLEPGEQADIEDVLKQLTAALHPSPRRG
jgi:hypothetical protein